MPKKVQEKSSEEKSAEGYFPVEEDYKTTTEKPVKIDNPDIKSTTEKIIHICLL